MVQDHDLQVWSSLLVQLARVSKEMQPVAFIDSNPSLHGTYLGSIKVLHPKKLERLLREEK